MTEQTTRYTVILKALGIADLDAEPYHTDNYDAVIEFCNLYVDDYKSAIIIDTLTGQRKTVECGDDAILFRWIAQACINTNYVNVVDTFQSDYWSEVEDYIIEKISEGYDVCLIDNDDNSVQWAYHNEESEENT